MNTRNLQRNAQRSAGRRLLLVLVGLVVFLVYAYATDVTDINLETPQDPQRQAVTTRVLRALAHPDFFVYEEETRSMNIGIRIPCGEVVSDFEFSRDERQILLSPNCANTTQDTIVVTGRGFRPRTSGIIRWHPPGDVQTTRALTSFSTDGEGSFRAEFEMPDIRPHAELQRIEIEEKWRIGLQGLSETSLITIEKIIETIFLALVATTVGTLLAVPVSFLGARNLMMPVGSPLAAVMTGVVALPMGWFVAAQIVRWLLSLAALLDERTGLALLAAAILFLLAWLLVTRGPSVLNPVDDSLQAAVISGLGLLAAALLAFLSLAILAQSGLRAGNWLEDQLGSFAFLGRFLYLMSDAVRVLSPTIAGMICGFAAAMLGSHYGQEAVLRWDKGVTRLFTGIMSALGTFVIIYGIGWFLNWLYQFSEPAYWTTYPALVAALLAGVVGLFVAPKRQFPIGAFIYTATRSILNITRSIEPLIYVIVFAVWVGIGPFAGILALTLHTIASLGKLFSEQVENIVPGPLEAVTATGANRLQTIVFAVIPQVVPPYVAFTLYRWDINVRFSTVLGFGGGGGIGFVLFQNINLLQYRQASVMMIAIAVVVMTLDYISSQIRSRII